MSKQQQQRNVSGRRCSGHLSTVLALVLAWHGISPTVDYASAGLVVVPCRYRYDDDYSSRTKRDDTIRDELSWSLQNLMADAVMLLPRPVRLELTTK
jgi:hypothetical protein